MGNFFKIQISSNRIFGLDILRALAIFFVVAGHGGNLVENETYKYVNMFLFDGVGIFFVLSGFLIGRILISSVGENDFNWKFLCNFWARRWFRTLPNYFLILSIVVILNLLVVNDFRFNDVFSYYFFSQNIFSSHPSFFPEAWSLSIEEWFYISTPLVILVFTKIFKLPIKKSILVTVFTFIIGITYFRFHRFMSYSISDIDIWNEMLRTQVVTRLDSLMFGVFGAYISINHFIFWQRHKILFLLLGISLFVFDKFYFLADNQYTLYECVFSFSIISLATFCLLPYLSSLKTGKGLVFRNITVFSMISYSMYLVNYTLVLEWIIIKINWDSLNAFNGYFALIVKYLLFWILTVFISIFLYKYFEKPVLKFRDKITVN